MLAVSVFLLFGGKFSDVYVRLRSHAPLSEQVALVTIGDESLYLFDSEASGEATPRKLLAHIVSFLDQAGAGVVVLDFDLDQPGDGDEELAAAIAALEAEVLAERYRLTDPARGREHMAAATWALSEVGAAGFANMGEEAVTLFSDELLVRSTPLVRRVSRSRLRGRWPQSLVGGELTESQMVASVGLQAAWLQQARRMEPDVRAEDLWALLDQHCEGVPLRCSLVGADLGLPALPGPLEDGLSINFRGPEAADGLATVSAARVLRALGESALLAELGVDSPVAVPPELRELFSGRVVVVGRVGGSDAVDRFVTPYSWPMLFRADMSGCRIHAQVIDTLLSGRHTRQVPSVLSGLLAVVLVVGSFVSAPRMRASLHVLGWLGVAGALVVGGILLFRWTDGLILDLALPEVGLMTTLFLYHLRSWAVADAPEG